MSVTVRPWNRAEDEALVYDSWLKSAREDLVKHRPYDAGSCATDVGWYAAQREVIDRILGREHAEVHVAELEGLVIGWLCCSAAGQRVHYAYVKSAYRRRGVFVALAIGAQVVMQPIIATHLTSPVLAWQRAGRPVVYDPGAA